MLENGYVFPRECRNSAETFDSCPSGGKCPCKRIMDQSSLVANRLDSDSDNSSGIDNRAALQKFPDVFFIRY